MRLSLGRRRVSLSCAFLVIYVIRVLDFHDFFGDHLPVVTTLGYVVTATITEHREASAR